MEDNEGVACGGSVVFSIRNADEASAFPGGRGDETLALRGGLRAAVFRDRSRSCGQGFRFDRGGENIRAEASTIALAPPECDG